MASSGDWAQESSQTYGAQASINVDMESMSAPVSTQYPYTQDSSQTFGTPSKYVPSQEEFEFISTSPTRAGEGKKRVPVNSTHGQLLPSSELVKLIPLNT